MRLKIFYKLLALLFIFSISFLGSISGNERKVKIVVFPFRYNCDPNSFILGVDDVMRTELIRSGYFTVTEQERTYEFMQEAMLYNIIKIENADVKNGLTKANIVDLFAKVDPKIIIRVAEKIKAGFALKGTLNQFGDMFRADIEVIHVKAKETLSVLVGECESKEKILELIEQLSQQIVNVCKGANVQTEIDYIQCNYQQGNFTYEEATERLRNLSSEIPCSFLIHCILFSHYLGHQEMRNHLIEEGKVLLNLFTANEEDIRCLSSLGIDPFYELANIYCAMKRFDDAIDVYNRVIPIYPVNQIKYYKHLGELYKLKGKNELAISAFSRVLSTNQADNETRLNLASVYEASGDILGAIEQYQYSLKYTKNIMENSKVKEAIKRLQSSKGAYEK
ncbi:MAG: hypothetical protein CV087_14825 [Candidatus Brocadia sp. WS118]|nr:MAG: hypothetical protein CV087_14825 [Candidatus Brocadia sp. WS118]